MALPDYFTHEHGNPILWGQSGIGGGVNALNFNNLTNGTARMGVSVNLGANWQEEYYVQLIIETGTAPTAGTRVDLYLASSYNGTTWPGGVSGSENAFTGSFDQLGWPVTSLIARALQDTIQYQQPVIWRPRGQYVAPVVHNNMNQPIRSEMTATNNDSRVVLVPVRAVIQDA